MVSPKGYARQGFNGILVSLSVMSMGMMFAWPSGTQKLFTSDETTLDRPMDLTEEALFGSLSSFGAIFSTPFTGYLLDKIGRKKCTILLTLFQVLSWSLIVACNKVAVVQAALVLAGVSGSTFMVAPVYISELCEESIRGAMTNMSIISYCFGILLAYVFGGYLQYDHMVWTCLSVSVLAVVAACCAKESPIYLMQIGQSEEATRTIAYFKAMKTSDKEVQDEIDLIRRTLNPEMDYASPDESEQKFLKTDVKSPPQPVKKMSTWQFFKKSSSTRRAFFVCMVLVTGSIFQGLVVVQVYADSLFQEAVQSIPSATCCIIFAVVTMVSCVVASYFTEKAGRKSLMVWGSVGSAICCVLLGTQMHLKWGPNVMTAVWINIFTVVFSLGPGTMPYVLSAEVFLPEIRSIVNALVFEWAWVCNFTILFIYNPIAAAIGIGPMFYIFAVVCFLTAVFSATMLPETQGLTLDEIQLRFVPKRKRLEIKTDAYA